jgi:hypothetical protein
MPITVNHNKNGGYVVLRATATDSIKLNTANGKQGANAAGELVRSMSVADIKWSLDSNNTWTIARGSNTIAILHGQGDVSFQEDGMRLELDTAQLTSNVVATLSGGTGFVVIKLHKVSGE